MNGSYKLQILWIILVIYEMACCQCMSLWKEHGYKADSAEENFNKETFNPHQLLYDRQKNQHHGEKPSRNKSLNELQLSLVHSMQHLQISGEIDTGKPPKQMAWQDVKLWFVNRVEINFDCDTCKIVVKAVQILADWHVSAKTLVDDLAKLCADLKIEDKRVCFGVMNMFQDEVLTVLGSVTLTPTQICGFSLGGQGCGEDHDLFKMWNVTFPDVPKPPVVPPKPPKPRSPVMRVLQLSDIHLDFAYKPGSNTECGEPLCCHDNDGPVKGEPAGQWGDYRYCDTPKWTLENLFQHLAEEQQFDYIIWLGDLPGHRVWNQTRTHQLKAVKFLTDLFQKYFPNKPIFPALGNHESSPVNSYPPPFIHGNHSVTWLYKALATNWTSNRHWLPNNTFPDIAQGAYYTVLVKPGFRIVSLNMNYCNNMNWWLLLNMTDPAGMLQWFIKVLQHAEDHQEKVHVLGHIPPGLSDCLKAWSWNYYKIINRYESTITGQYFGHTHHDTFEMFYDESSNFTRPVSVGYLGPSVTPYQFLNPAYRIYVIDGDYKGTTWSVVDHETYIMNLTQANKPGGTPAWKLEYSAKAQYNMSSLFPRDWDKLLHQMKMDDTLFNNYRKFGAHSYPQGPCDAACRSAVLCDARTGRSYDPNLCKDWVKDYGTYLHRYRANKVC